MAHVRRKFVDVHKAQGSPIAEEAIRRIGELYAIEKQIRGQPPDERVATRKAQSEPLFDDLEIWLKAQLSRVGWASMTDGVSMFLAVYKNGALHKEAKIVSGGTQGDQGPTIDVLVSVGSTTDYFEIYARQETGGNVDINGASSLTWAMFEMVD